MFDFKETPKIQLRNLNREELAYIQLLLQKSGYNIGHAKLGEYGLETEIAFTNFKSDQFLEFPLILGESTYTALLEEAGLRGDPKAPSTEIDGMKPHVEKNIPKVRIAGFGELLITTNVSRWFTWGEVTHGGTRPIKDNSHAHNARDLAIRLDRFRDFLGKPIIVTSWYRPEPWNSAAGGAKKSMHLYGKAVDIKVVGMTGKQIGEKAIKFGWRGGLGIYKDTPGILHLDTGSNRRWGF